MVGVESLGSRGTRLSARMASLMGGEAVILIVGGIKLIGSITTTPIVSHLGSVKVGIVIIIH